MRGKMLWFNADSGCGLIRNRRGVGR
jgi:cold shock CspA family protein